MAVIQPHIEAASSGPSSSGSITTALTQRVKTLQEENDELYNLLKKSETGRLKEEVHGLSRVVSKLENALRGKSLSNSALLPCKLIVLQNHTKSFNLYRESIAL